MVDKRGTWLSGAGSFLFAIAIAMGIRWALFEAYVIPSGSMLPSLLIQDHIFVNKLVYGIRVPFSKQWLVHFKNPSRGEVIVFKYPEKESVFFIKRVIGVPGDKISWDGEQLAINGEKVPTGANPKKDFFLGILKDAELSGGKETYDVLEEKPNDDVTHPVLIKRDAVHMKVTDYEVPQDALFVMGDNRDNSNDSRYWGIVPMENILGRAMFVWLSCDETFQSLTFLCDPTTLRWRRFLHVVR